MCWEARVIPPARVRMLPIPASAAMIIFFFGFVSGVLFVGWCVMVKSSGRCVLWLSISAWVCFC